MATNSPRATSPFLRILGTTSTAALVWLVLMVTLLTGCTTCDDIGCTDSVIITATEVPERTTICMGSTCTTIEPSAGPVRETLPFRVEQLPAAVRVDKNQYRVRVSVPTGERFIQVRSEEFRPGPSSCDTCSVVQLRL